MVFKEGQDVAFLQTFFWVLASRKIQKFVQKWMILHVILFRHLNDFERSFRDFRKELPVFEVHDPPKITGFLRFLRETNPAQNRRRFQEKVSKMLILSLVHKKRLSRRRIFKFLLMFLSLVLHMDMDIDIVGRQKTIQDSRKINFLQFEMSPWHRIAVTAQAWKNRKRSSNLRCLFGVM